MINRRKFCLSLMTFPAVLAMPSLAIPGNTAIAEAEALPITDKIRELENFVSSHPNEFSWWAHNELRHEYLPISERMSRKYADILLANSVMDEYILNTLSDWHLTDWETPPNPGRAVAILLDNAECYGNFAHLKAACLLKAGDVYRENHTLTAAYQLYHRVMNVGRLSIIPLPTLKPYHALAQSRIASYGSTALSL
jgi:hypothetical protein